MTICALRPSHILHFDFVVLGGLFIKDTVGLPRVCLDDLRVPILLRGSQVVSVSAFLINTHSILVMKPHNYVCYQIFVTLYG